MMHLNPMMNTFGYGYPPLAGMPYRHVRAPPRSVPAPIHAHRPRAHVEADPTPCTRAQAKNAAPIIELQESTGVYTALIKSPSSEYVLRDVEASLDGASILIKGTLVNDRAGVHQYITRSRAGVYAEPNGRALVGILPAGSRVSGGEPTRSGWIALDDDESWMMDDGSLALATRPTLAPPMAFAKRVSLPSDAELRHARIRENDNGELLLTVPRATRRAATAPRDLPIHVKRGGNPAAAPPQTKPAAPTGAAAKSTSKPAPKTAPSTPSSTPKGGDVSAEQYKQAHKRKAAEARTQRGLAAELAELHGIPYEGPVLTECDEKEVSSRNVQSPTESVEEWVATADGGFVPSDGDEEMTHVDKKRSFTLVEEEGDLAYWGF